jgi:hypothetical protein
MLQMNVDRYRIDSTKPLLDLLSRCVILAIMSSHAKCRHDPLRAARLAHPALGATHAGERGIRGECASPRDRKAGAGQSPT